MNSVPRCQMPRCKKPREITLHDKNAKGGMFEMCLSCARRVLDCDPGGIPTAVAIEIRAVRR